MKRKDAGMLATVALVYIALEAVGVTCPIKFLTGISCAGCGMSRAWLALLRGDWAEALAFHPLVLLPIPAGLLLALRKRLPKRLVDVGLWTCGVLFIVVYFVRMIQPGDVVVFAPQEGAIWRLVSGLLARMR